MDQTNLYPVNLSLKEKKCVVVGGGKVAQRKAKSLVNCGARVFVISPSLNTGLNRLAGRRKIFHIKKRYSRQFLKGAFLAVVATNDARINSRVAYDAGRLNLLVNVVDSPGLSNFWVPAVFRRGPLAISISTSGHSPYLAGRLKTVLKKNIGPEYAQFLKLLGSIRKKVKAKYRSLSKCKSVYARILKSPVLKLLKEKKAKEAREVLSRILGD